MTPKTLAETLAAVQQINGADKPFKITTSGNNVVGTWNIVSVEVTNLLGGQQIDKDYTVTFTLNENDHTFDFNEKKVESESKIGANLDGSIGASKSKSFFSGKSIGKQWGAGAGLSVTQNGQPAGNTYSYSFETSKIKGPIIDALKANGWKQKGGFLSRLFGR